MLRDDQVFQLDSERGELLTAELLPLESAIFAAAQQLGHVSVAPEITRLLAEAKLQEDALPIAREALASYFAAALIMPYEPFYRACVDTRYDVERVGRLFKVSFEQVCHRMTTLQRPGLSGVPLHLVRTDIAGNISKRFSLSGIHIPRHSGACPRWNVYSAFLNPDQINVQISQMPEGQRYLCIAKSITKGGYRHNALRRHLSIGLGCHISNASALVYSDGVDLMNLKGSVPIGVGCRVCPRDDCGQRAHPRRVTPSQ
jgi:predicted transcriptional regulator